jgi:hypothetical protein
MAKRKKQTTGRRRTSTARAKARKATTAGRKQATKQTVAKAKSGKRSRKAKPKRVGAKKVARKAAKRIEPSGMAEVETVIVDVIEEVAPGVIAVTEVEATEVRQPTSDSDEVQQGQGTMPLKSDDL